MRLTFFNGVDTVGGVQVLLSSSSGSLQFDLGVVRNPAIAPVRVLFNDYVQPRGSNALRDYLHAGMAPRVEGLFQHVVGEDAQADPVKRFAPGADDLPMVSRAEAGELGVFVSHAHDDHMELLPWVAQDVPIHVAASTGDFLQALGAAGEIPAPGPNVRSTKDNGSFQVGDIVVEPVAVDHDIPGCAGFIARTPSGTMAYTGDWRYHGNAPKLIDTFVERCRQADVDVLMTEGSTLVTGQARPECSEQEVAERFDALLPSATGLVTVTPAARNVERVSAFVRAAAAHGRRLALTPTTARILWESNRLGFETSVEDVGITVLALEDEFDDLPEEWDVVQVDDVAADRSAFVCEISPERWHLWLDLRAGSGDLHVHSNGSPYGQGDPLWQVLETWVGQLGFGLEVLDSHGHAFPRDLEWLAREIAPRVVIPVHSNHPSSFPVGNYRLVLPGRGETIELHG